MKTAIISGITGQDGSYLAKKLVENEVRVIGLVRHGTTNYFGIQYLGVANDITIHPIDLTDKVQMDQLITKYQPDYYYNLAAQSSVAQSFKDPAGTVLFNISSTLNALESIRLKSPKTRFYQATSSEMYGSVSQLPITEETLLNPQSPYASSKAACHHLVHNYRESYGLHASSGILFNHESVLRKDGFFIKKIIHNALDIKHGKRHSLKVGNIDIKRDFGFAPKYVEAMILMTLKDESQDYIICSGTSVSLKSVVHYVFDTLNLDKDLIQSDPLLFRPTEIQDIYGDSAKAKKELDWKYDLSFFEVLNIIISEYETTVYKK